ncbi:MAG TPA: FlgD immunoglobulin-like domain containing protein [bacterium]|nr:FlgD immunoglobulin-like domain containing protein [bacterium]
MNQAALRTGTVVILALVFSAGIAAAATPRALVTSGDIQHGGRQTQSSLEKAKAAACPRPLGKGGPEQGRRESSGGPDDYGYVFLDETEVGGPTYNWIDTVGATGLSITGDDTFEMVALPFTFTFYGTGYDYCYPSTNGQMGLSSGIRNYSNYALPTTYLPANHLCPYWDDLYVDTSSSILYKTVGTAPNRKFVVIWDSVRTLSYSYRLVFEAILSESDNSITYQYRYLDTGAMGQSATVGEQQAQTGNNYLQYSYNTNSLIEGRAIKFWRPQYTADVGTRRIVAPQGFYLADTIHPSAIVKNYGTASQSNFGVKLDIGAGYTSTVNVAGPLAPGDTFVVNTFAPWVPTIAGQYAVACSTRLAGDMFTLNDRETTSTTIVSLVEHFDSSNGGYVPYPDSGHWVWRAPAYPRPSPPSPPNVWTIPDSSTYQTYESSYVASCVYIATQDSPMVMFYHWLYCESYYDGGNFSYSTDNGSTWTILDPDGTRAYYGTLRSGERGYSGTIPWEMAAFQVPVLHDSAFMLRWKFMSDVSIQYEGGWMFDDFAGVGIARPPADVGAVQIVAPGDTVQSGSAVAPRAAVRNFGSAQQTFVVRFSVSDGYQDTFRLTLAAGRTDTIQFKNWSADSLGTFSIACSTELAGDVDHANDAVHGSVVVVPSLAVTEKPGLPGVFALDNALPNPFTGRTVVRFGVAHSGQTNVSIYSPAGTLVRTLCSSVLTPARYSLAWDGKDERGRAVPAGVYFCRLQAGGRSTSKRITLVR